MLNYLKLVPFPDAIRYLCFVQGVMFAHRMITVDEADQVLLRVMMNSLDNPAT